MKKLNGAYALCIALFLIAVLGAWILAGKYSGGDEGAKNIVLYVATPVFILYFLISTLLFLNKNDGVCSILLLRVVPGFSLVSVCLSLSLSVFFMHPLSSNIGVFLCSFFIIMFSVVFIYTIGTLKINFNRYLELIVGMASSTGEIAEKDVFSLLPKNFFLFDKIHIFFGLLILASEVIGFNLRNAYPAFSSVAIAIPFFILVCLLLQYCVVYLSFVYIFKKAQQISNCFYFFKENKKMKTRKR